MPSPRDTICLCLTVRNAAAMIRRCLDSAQPLIDRWVAVDTGSTDGTQAIIRERLKDVPGELRERPGRDGAADRCEALALARPKAAYSLVVEGSEVLVPDAGFRYPPLHADCYFAAIDHAGRRTSQPRLFSNALAWRYEGVVAAFPSVPDERGSGRLLPEQLAHAFLPGLRIVAGEDDAPFAKDNGESLRRDAAMLAAALAREGDDFLRARYLFHLAQLHMALGEGEQALAAYVSRSRLGFSKEEIFLSLMRAGRLRERLGRPFDEVMATYAQAAALFPGHAEPLYAASRFCREKERFVEGLAAADRGLRIPKPEDGLPVEPVIYEYGLLGEVAANAYRLGRFDVCLQACETLLRHRALPQELRTRIEWNAARARDRLAAIAIHGGKDRWKKIGLCMMVKDEAKVIRRCLDSIRPLLDYALVEDTGSTDGTPEIVRAWLAETGVPGEVLEETWENFAHNRNIALAQLRQNGAIDYAWLLDADDTVELPDGFTLPELTADGYTLECQDAAVGYRRIRLVRNDASWRCRGVVNDFLASESPHTIGHLPIVIRRHYDGARRRDPDTPREYEELLERALRTETDAFLVARYTYQLAQSYRDGGKTGKALATYMRRAELGFWQEEVFVSLLNAGRLQDSLGRPAREVLNTYERASNTAPHRAEALYAASYLCRMHRRFAEAAAYARRGLEIALPPAGLFVETEIYQYGLLDEFAVSAFEIGCHDEAIAACERLLREGNLPAGVRQRVEGNVRIAKATMAETRASTGARKTPVPPAFGSGPSSDVTTSEITAAGERPPVSLPAETAVRPAARPSGRFCVFASAGDRHTIADWLRPEPRGDWDLITAYYGDDDRQYRKLADISTRAFRSKGGKFQNLKHALEREPGLLSAYDFVWVCDDDLLMTSRHVARMFQTAERFGFWVCQPAFSRRGKISFEATSQMTPDGIRIVNFVEVTCPLFRREKLDAFMRVYDGSLAGWGTDFWYANVLDARRNPRFAVVDYVVVTNPHDEDKPSRFSEIDRLQPKELRQARWRTLKDRLGLAQWVPETLWTLFPNAAPTESEAREELEKTARSVAAEAAYLLPLESGAP